VTPEFRRCCRSCWLRPPDGWVGLAGWVGSASWVRSGAGLPGLAAGAGCRVRLPGRVLGPAAGPGCSGTASGPGALAGPPGSGGGDGFRAGCRSVTPGSGVGDRLRGGLPGRPSGAEFEARIWLGIRPVLRGPVSGPRAVFRAWVSGPDRHGARVGSRGWLAVGAGWQVESGRWWVLGRCLDRAARWLSSVRGRAEGVGLSCRVSRPGRQGRVFRSGFRGGCPARATGAGVVGAGHRTACSGQASGPDVWAWLPDRVFGLGFRTACSGQAFRTGCSGLATGPGVGAASASGTQAGPPGPGFRAEFRLGVWPVLRGGRPAWAAGGGCGCPDPVSRGRTAGEQVGKLGLVGWWSGPLVGPGQAPWTGRQHGSRQLAVVPEGSIRPVPVCLLRSSLG
jgi:hypothetical protein